MADTTATERPYTIWSDDDEPWGITEAWDESCDSPCVCPWCAIYYVNRERGDGSFIAKFEWRDHAEEFVRAFGPCNGEILYAGDDEVGGGG